MAASRCVTSLLKLSSFTSSNLTCGQLHRLGTAHQNVLCRLRPISSNSLSANRFLQFRYFSQKVDDHNQPAATTQKTTPSSILGSIQGLGIAGEVLKKQEETQTSDGQAKSSSSGQEQKQNEEEEEAAKRKKEAEASWRAMKYTLIFFSVTLSGLTGYIVATWGAPERDEEGNVIEDQFSSKPLALQFILRSWNAMRNYSQV